MSLPTGVLFDPLAGVTVPLENSILASLLPMSRDVLWVLSLALGANPGPPLAPQSVDVVDFQGFCNSLSCGPPGVRAGAPPSWLARLSA